MRRTVALCLVFVALMFSTARAETLTIVCLEAHPLEYQEAGQAKGLNVDIARAALTRMGYDAEFVFVPWRRALRMVQTGTADAILDAGWNEDRADYLHYPEEPIYVEEIYAFKLAARELSLDKDFRNAKRYTLGAGRGHFYGANIDRALQRNEFKNVDFIGDVELNIDKLLARRIDMFLGVRAPFEWFLRQRDLADVIGLVPMSETGEPYLLGRSPTFLAFSKQAQGEMIARKTSLVLHLMREEGVFERIASRYQ